MRRFSVISLFALVAICATGTLKAQDRGVRANVPFDFVVGSKHLPSGSYQFLASSARSSNPFLIRNANGQVVMLSMTHEAGDVSRHDCGLIFYKYGDRYFLHDVYCPAIAINVAIPFSKEEKQIRQQQARLEPDRILLALNSSY
jgi:hypothetical protein